jgi:hypothetical protein
MIKILPISEKENIFEIRYYYDKLKKDKFLDIFKSF